MSGTPEPSEVVVSLLAIVLLLAIAALLFVVHRAERPDPKWRLYSSLIRNIEEGGSEHEPISSKCRLN